MKRFSLVALFCLIPLVLFAADSKTGMIKVNGTELYYETIGEGTPILILHGGPGLNHSYFLPQMAGLAKNHKLIFFDQRATGKSSMKLDTSAVNLKNCLGDIEGLRKAFKLGKMNLMGHSFGGLLAMEYAMKYPKNLRSLTLVCTSAPSSALRMKAFMNMQSKQSPEDSAGQAQIMQSDGFKRRDPETMSKFFHFLFSSDFYDRKMDDSLTLQFDTNYAKSGDLLRGLNRDFSKFDITDSLKAIMCPTLIVTTDHDRNLPESMDIIHQHIANSKIVEIKNSGHFPFVEAPKEFFKIVEDFVDHPAVK